MSQSNQRPDLLARRVVRDIMIYTRGLKMRPVPLETVARRLVLKDADATSAALTLAEIKGWLTVKDGASLSLTDAGRQMARQ
jgi:Mn-dependent DtxR family transcriptional regulator